MPATAGPDKGPTAPETNLVHGRLGRSQTMPDPVRPFAGMVDPIVEAELAKMTESIRRQLGSKQSPPSSTVNAPSDVPELGSSVSLELARSLSADTVIAAPVDVLGAGTSETAEVAVDAGVGAGGVDSPAVLTEVSEKEVAKEVVKNETSPLERPPLNHEKRSDETIVLRRVEDSGVDLTDIPSSSFSSDNPACRPQFPNRPAPSTPSSAPSSSSELVPRSSSPSSPPVSLSGTPPRRLDGSTPSPPIRSAKPRLISRLSLSKRALPMLSLAGSLSSGRTEVTSLAAAGADGSDLGPEGVGGTDGVSRTARASSLAEVADSPTRALRHRASFPGAVDQGRVGFGQDTKPERWL
jgi:hypothetical protein